jgi:hypothetical protein
MEKRLKPCSKTTQFSIGLHCQAHKRHRTELVRGYLASSNSWCWNASMGRVFDRKTITLGLSTPNVCKLPQMVKVEHDHKRRIS